MNSQTRYNLSHEGAFNYERPQRFSEITEDDKREACNRLAELIRDTREDLGAMFYE